MRRILLALAVLIACAAHSGFAPAEARSVRSIFKTCQSPDPHVAIRACDNVLARKMPASTRAAWLAVRGLAHHRAGNDARAFDDFAQALRLDPRQWSALNARGLMHNDRREFDKALVDLNAGIQIAGDKGPLFHNRGITWNGKKDHHRAIADFNRAIDLGTKVAGTYYGRGSAYFELGKYDEAIADFDETIKADPKYVRAYNLRGAAFRNKGEYAEALKALSEAIAIDPKFSTAYVNRGFTYRRMNDFDRALRDYDEAIRLDPKLALAYFHRGIAHKHKNEIDAAYRDIVQALALNPGHEPSKSERDNLVSMLARQPGGASKPTTNVSATPDNAPSPPPTLTVAQPSGLRVALVIGNGRYKFAPELLNPANDARDMAGALRDLGFKVIEGYDLDSAGMRAKIAQFGEQMPGATTTLFFYAGHGVQVAGRNYLVPTDSKLERPSALNVEAIDVNSILADMETEKRTNLVFLDACRNNPLTRSLVSALGRTRSAKVGQGLAQLNAGIGTLITFATSPNTVALDGNGRNSPFTAALLHHIRTPDVEIRALLTRVRADVIKATNERQIPWDHSSLVGEFYFARGSGG